MCKSNSDNFLPEQARFSLRNGSYMAKIIFAAPILNGI
jgi:hypothetical protein